VCVVVFFVAFFGLAAYLFLFKHRAKAVATQAASVSLDMFIHRTKAVATQVASVSLDMFIHKAKAVAKQAASVSLDMFFFFLPHEQTNILRRNIKLSREKRISQY
jgi:hypothetical protein